MVALGIGQNGYLCLQKETTYGTAATTSMVMWPALPGSSFSYGPSNIENNNVINSRLKQTPNKGRNVAKFSIKIHMPFTLIGSAMNFFLGTSTNSGTGAFVHTWLTPTSGSYCGSSFTMDVAKGAGLADRFVGCVVTDFSLNSDSTNNITLTFDGVAQSVTEGVARASVFAYPATIPGNFSMVNVVVNGSSLSCDSVELKSSLNYVGDNFKIGSSNIVRPEFKGIPTLTMKLKTNADSQFVTDARNHTIYTSNLVEITSNENANGTTKFKFAIEIPKMKLNPETSAPYENDKLSMDLDFDCGFGGTTTGSPTTSVMAEYRVTDATATYA